MIPFTDSIRLKNSKLCNTSKSKSKYINDNLNSNIYYKMKFTLTLQPINIQSFVSLTKSIKSNLKIDSFTVQCYNLYTLN